jgi:hypothetical protein
MDKRCSKDAVKGIPMGLKSLFWALILGHGHTVLAMDPCVLNLIPATSLYKKSTQENIRLVRESFNASALPGEAFVASELMFAILPEYTPAQVRAVAHQEHLRRRFLMKSTRAISSRDDLIPIVRRLQTFLQAQFPVIVGTSFKLDLLRDVRVLADDDAVRDWADGIFGKMILTPKTLTDRAQFIRAVVHESIHLHSRSDDHLILLKHNTLGANYTEHPLLEGWTEYLTMKTLASGEREGLPAKFNFTYQQWAKYLDYILIRQIFKGDAQPLHDFFNTGDLVTFSRKLREAFRSVDTARFDVPDDDASRQIFNDIEMLMKLRVDSQVSPQSQMIRFRSG